MKKIKFATSKSVDTVCKEIEQMIPCVLGTKPNKEKRDKETVYYPARRFMCADDDMDDIRIIVRKVNNSLTNIRLEDSERHEQNENWRANAIRKAYSTLENILSQMFRQ